MAKKQEEKLSGRMIKVTNFRQGEILLPFKPHTFPSGVSFHSEEHMNALPEEVVASLQDQIDHGELKIEQAQVGEEKPSARQPVFGKGAEPPPENLPSLSNVEGEALSQIASETDEGVLAGWFDLDPKPSVIVSNAIMARVTQLHGA